MLAEERAVRVALIGFGAIGEEVFRQARGIKGLHIGQILVRASRMAETQARIGADARAVTAVDDFDDRTDVVLEAAGHGALATFGASVLARGFDLCVASVGALVDDRSRDTLTAAARAGGARLEILPGAIGGIDALAAVGAEGLEAVAYTGRKPPRAWAGSPAETSHDLAAMSEETVIFEGSAREAAMTFPKNANVVATVALAGLGCDATRVRLIADPAASSNSHRIEARGPLVNFDFTTQGKPLPANPRSSALTALSALRALRNRAGPLVL